MPEQPLRRGNHSRRTFLKRAAALGLGAAGAAMFPGSNVRVDAIRRGGHRPGKARNEEVRDQNRQDFSAGEAHGASVRGQGAAASVRGKSGAAFKSRPIPVPFAPTHVGLIWTSHGAPSDITLSVRGSGNGQDWSTWQQVGIEAISSNAHGAIPVHGELTDESLLDVAGARIFGTLAGMNRPQFLQYWIDFHSDHDVDIGEVALACIDAAGDDEDSSAAWFATARADEINEVTLTNSAEISINVITREGWGVNEDHDYTWEERFVPVKKVFLHHTATSNNYSNGAAEVRAIHSYHATNLGWGDIGYQILVDRFGNIYEGRRGRVRETGDREVLSNGVEGGHVLSYNYGSTGIAALGNSQQGQWNRFWGDAGLDAIVDAVAFECGRHFLHPEGKSDFLRTDRVWHEALTHCVGHRDGTSTQCPGSRLYDFLNNELRDRVAGKLEGDDPPSGLAAVQDEDQLQFDWNAASDEDFHYFFEGWWRWVDDNGVSHIDYLSEHSSDFASHGWGDHSGAGWDGGTKSGNSADFSLTATGQYTLHIRKAGEDFAFADHYTVLVEDLEAEPDEPDEPEEFQVFGGVHVTAENEDEVLGEPIEGATVTLVGGNDVNMETITNEEGDFEFGKVPAGDYDVTATAEGYEPETVPITVEDTDFGVIFQLDPVEDDSDDDDGDEDEEPAEPIIDHFAVDSRTTGPWFRADVRWEVSGSNLESVTSELLNGNGNVLDSTTSSVSGSTASGEHELRTRDNGPSTVLLTVTDVSGNSHSEERSV
ncbi:MAG: twin-arginine translocation signal domain-containing protein [Sphaerobacteraceae bacterium]|nr:MAG: twin-arginine translocation signal domain-containing protein [Sphaerobacteraceae bacterium]